MKRKNDYWVDDRGNRWEACRFTKERSKAFSDRLINCDDCDNCFNCEACDGCFDCVDCSFCQNCRCCSSCEGCSRCSNCEACDGCEDCSGGNGLIRCFRLREGSKVVAQAIEAAIKKSIEKRSLENE